MFYLKCYFFNFVFLLLSKEFLGSRSFTDDFKLFISRYDDEIRELDESITKKESISNDAEKIKQFRFNTIDKIKKIEKEKELLIETLQNKHKINLDYNLVSSEILLF